MNTRRHTKLVHEGDYVAEVDTVLIEEEGGWSPYLSLEEATKLDKVRDALRRGDLLEAKRHARVYRLVPVAA